MLQKIISGGQTGAARAALDVAIEMRIPHGGWVPEGRKTEEGRLPKRYQLKESTTIDYAQRTELNVLDSDGTLILSHGNLQDDSALTQDLARKHVRPCLHMDLKALGNKKAVDIICSWLDIRKIKTLNVAGPRGSRDPMIYNDTREVLFAVLRTYLPGTIHEAVNRLISEMSLKDKSIVANMDDKDLMNRLPVMGAYVRDKLGLKTGNHSLLESCRFFAKDKHLDENAASTVILHILRENLRDSHVMKIVK